MEFPVTPEKTEKFNPKDPKYKRVEDLPEQFQNEFINYPEKDGGGFGRKEALEKRANFIKKSKELNSERGWTEKVFGKNKITPKDLEEEQAYLDHWVETQRITREKEERITPINKISEDIIVQQNYKPDELFPENIEKKEEDPKLTQIAKKMLDRYQDYLEQRSTRKTREKLEEGIFLKDEDMFSYGKEAKIVGQVKIKPFGPTGRFIVSFETTNLENGQDSRVFHSSFMFDIEPTTINESYPARLENHFVLGKEPDGQYEIIGRYKELKEQTHEQESIEENARKKGYAELIEAWPMDIDRFVSN